MTYWQTLISAFLDETLNPWILIPVATGFAIITFRHTRRENPTLSIWLPLIRSTCFGLFMASHAIEQLIPARYGPAGLFPLVALAIGMPAGAIIGIRKHTYNKAKKLAARVPDPVYVDGGADTWPPAPSIENTRKGDIV